MNALMKLVIHRLTMWSSSTKFFIFLLFISVCSIAGYAGEDSPHVSKAVVVDSSVVAMSQLDSLSQASHLLHVPKTIVLDSSVVVVRQLDSLSQATLFTNDDYKYNRDAAKSASAWDRFWDWFNEKIDELLNTKNGKISIKIIKYLIILIALVAIVFLLLKNKVGALFYGKSAATSIGFNELEENIHLIDFEELIAKAREEKDFRRAVRLHFLKLLKELSDKNLIAWKIDKTNKDYSIELLNTQYNAHFKELAELYEYVWYGNFLLDEAGYTSTLQKFKTFEI